AYAEMAARIADALVQQAMPKANGLTPREFDYAADKVLKYGVRLRDHGNESIPGLSEAYALAVSRGSDPAWRGGADRGAEPIAKMYELLFKKSLNADGLFVSVIDGKTLAVSDPQPNDNWAYVLNGVMLFTQAARLDGKVDPARLDALDA